MREATLSQKTYNPRVFVAIPTGPPKRYALAYMFAALQNLDYSNKEVHFAVTRYKGGYKSEEGFPDAIVKMYDAVPLGCKTAIHWKWLKEDKMRPYGPVLNNLALLRGLFLDGDYDYFLLLGGDNPPPRETINRLLALDADVACGLVYQRPYRGIGNMAYPLVYTYSWTLDELPPNLPKHLRREFEKTWRASMFYLPIYLDPEWRKDDVITEFTGGSGCTLIKREVLENIGFYLPLSCYHSEDINFFTWAKYLGYSTKCDLTFHVPHHDDSGYMW
jgi:hypothetical protein